MKKRTISLTLRSPGYVRTQMLSRQLDTWAWSLRHNYMNLAFLPYWVVLLVLLISNSLLATGLQTLWKCLGQVTSRALLQLCSETLLWPIPDSGVTVCGSLPEPLLELHCYFLTLLMQPIVTALLKGETSFQPSFLSPFFLTPFMFSTFSTF